MPELATIGTPLFWTVFLLGVGAILVLDLGVLNRKAHVVKPREALLWVGLCVTLAALFAAWLFWRFGSRVGLEFVTGYLIEYALSVDNLFVFLVVFSYFSVPPQFQHRVLFWGIVGALVLRAVFILVGAALLAKFHWMIYVFGGFLVFTGIKLLLAGDDNVDPEKNPVLRLARRFLPVTSTYHGQSFSVIENGKRWFTPLLLVLIVIEATDVVFAVDSIPAIFGITRDPFIVFTSNIFAILGLRALYFLLHDFMGRFHYLKYGLGLVLAFVGAKMVASAWFKVPIGLSLAVIGTLLAGSVAVSWLFPPRDGKGAGQNQA
ncbi:MAG: TerC family protein [Thermoanaerobaculia bacterium]|nr:MAG: TerC family protein [Thermoanaerobaculia bacterium]MBZ0103179.1 TerC family protein [Thermoanaerobaculia bacterium]